VVPSPFPTEAASEDSELGDVLVPVKVLSPGEEVFAGLGAFVAVVDPAARVFEVFGRAAVPPSDDAGAAAVAPPAAARVGPAEDAAPVCFEDDWV